MKTRFLSILDSLTMRAGLVMCVALLLQSCALPFERPGQAKPVSAATAPTEAPVTPEPEQPRAPVATRVTAAESLRLQAVAAQEAGDFARAVALLERAQRIAPRDGAIYRDMASAHRAAGRTDLACQFARKGLSVPVETDVGEALEAQLADC